MVEGGQSPYGQPIFIMSEGSQRSRGKDAQQNNISAAKAVGETVRTTLGPKGMDKMLVDSTGDIVITNDGVTILDEMEIEHPAAKMMVEVAKTQEDEVGDGTTTSVVLASELLKKAEELLEKDIHPTVITKGFKLAKEKALGILEDKAIGVKSNEHALKKVATTAMTGKSAERASEHLSKISVDAVKMVKKGDEIDKNNIKIEKKQGGSIEDTELVKGVILDKEIVHSRMPRNKKDSKILLLDSPLEVKETETDAKIQISSPEQLEGFLDKEEKMLKKMVDKIQESGANIVFCQKGIDDTAQHYLARKGIIASRRVKKSDMDKLARATGAKLVSDVNDINKEDLGYAELTEEKRISGEKMLFVKGCKDPKAVSILVRGGTEHVVDEAKRAVDDSIGGVVSAMESGKVIAGGGAAEQMVAIDLKKYAQKLSGREQLAVEAFADAMEIVPRTLAENGGLDPIDVLVKMRSSHEQGKNNYGVDVFTGDTIDSWDKGVVEPLKIKTQAIKSAGEAAEMILRIDDVISSSSSGGGGEAAQPPMGGMPMA